MTTPKDRWEPIAPEALQAGMELRIDHRWFDHPFVRRFFPAVSAREITLIREAGLTRLFVNRRADSPAGPGEDEDPPSEAERSQAQREAIGRSKQRYQVAVERAVEMFGMINAADPASSQALGGDIENIVAMLNNSAAAPSLTCALAPPRTPKRLALMGYDAVILSGVVGKRLGLKAQALRVLTQAAAVHMVGLSRVPSHLMEEHADSVQHLSAQFRNYPALSVAILEQCGGFDEEVLRLVREHRERPDGSGFPLGLRADDLHPQALLLGAVRELLERCCGEGATPALALAHMHRTAREVYGADVIKHLAATLIAHPPGTFVQLSDGRLARVLSVDKESYLKPHVMVIADETSGREVGEVDLAKEPAVAIARVLETTQLPGQLVSSRRSAWSRGKMPKPPGPETGTSAEASSTAKTTAS